MRWLERSRDSVHGATIACTLPLLCWPQARVPAALYLGYALIFATLALLWHQLWREGGLNRTLSEIYRQHQTQPGRRFEPMAILAQMLGSIALIVLPG
jgi:hypothetical protein